MNTLAKDIILLLGLTLVSSGMGLAINQLKEKPMSLTYLTPAQRLTDPSRKLPQNQIVPAAGQSVEVSREIQIVTLDRLHAMKTENQLLLLDVRPNLFYSIGHIPGAHSLQAKEFETDHAKMKPLIEASIAQGKKIALYCSGSHCPDASKVAASLSVLGYGNLLVFEAGWEGWQQAALPEEQQAL